MITVALITLGLIALICLYPLAIVAWVVLAPESERKLRFIAGLLAPPNRKHLGDK